MGPDALLINVKYFIRWGDGSCDSEEASKRPICLHVVFPIKTNNNWRMKNRASSGIWTLKRLLAFRKLIKICQLSNFF